MARLHEVDKVGLTFNYNRLLTNKKGCLAKTAFSFNGSVKTIVVSSPKHLL